MRVVNLTFAFIIFLAPQVACGQTQKSRSKQEVGEPGPPAPKPYVPNVTDAPEVDKSKIKKRAEELSAAFVGGDFGKVVDLTFPDLVELVGGKAKMIADIEKEIGRGRAQGVQISSIAVEEPKQVLNERDYLLAIVPATMRMNVTDGVFSQQISYLGVSRDGGETWTFINGVNKQKLKTLFPAIPAAIDRLEIPEEKLPTLERSHKN